MNEEMDGYKGRLFGKVGGWYFPTSQTTDDVDKLKDNQFNWVKIDGENFPKNEQLLLFNKEWIDEDNKEGIRVGKYIDVNDWHTAIWQSHNRYSAAHYSRPTHFCKIISPNKM